MINNSKSLLARLALNEAWIEKTNATRKSAPKLGKRPGNNKMTQFSRKGMQKLQEQGDRITGVLESMEKMKLSNFNL